MASSKSSQWKRSGLPFHSKDLDLRRERQRPRLAFETLETRVLLDASGLGFGNARHLTLSIAPDATEIAAQSSALYATFNDGNLANVWQEELLRAFQTWAVHANINFGLVSYNGDAFGSSGLTFGDSRFGDIRIGATPLSSDVLAVAISHDTLVSGTWAGDVLFNSSAELKDPQALFTVAMHEAGHVLGLEHSDDPNSPMFRHNGTSALLPTSEDIANLQRLYGARPADANDGESGSKNNSFKQATQIKLPGDFSGATPLVAYGDITTASDVDVFELEPLGKYDGPVTFQLRTSGISLLAARLTLLDKTGRVLGQAESTAATGDVLTIQLMEMPNDSVVYAKVEGARDDVFGIGRYALVTTFDKNLVVDDATIDAVARGAYESFESEDIERLFLHGELPFYNDDGHTDDEFGAGTELESPEEFGPTIRYHTVGSLADAGDVDFYRFKSAEGVEGQPNVMTVTVRGLDGIAAEFQTTLYDTEGNIVPHEVLINHNGVYTIQVVNIKPDNEYVLKVVAGDSSKIVPAGNYNLDIGYGYRVYERQEFVSGIISSTEPTQKYTLTVTEPLLFHFGLRTSTQFAQASAVEMAIFDAEGRLIYELTGRVGQLRTGDSILLLPGVYSVRTVVPDVVTEPVKYTLLGAATSQPVGPELVDSAAVPMDPGIGNGTAFQHPYVWQPVDALPRTDTAAIPPSPPAPAPTQNVVKVGIPIGSGSFLENPSPVIQQTNLANQADLNLVPSLVPAPPPSPYAQVLPQKTGAGDISYLVPATLPPELPVAIPQSNVVDLPTLIPSPNSVSSTPQLPQERIVAPPGDQSSSVGLTAATVAPSNDISMPSVDTIAPQNTEFSVSRESLAVASTATNQQDTTDISGIVAAVQSKDVSTVAEQLTKTIQRGLVEYVNEDIPNSNTADLPTQSRPVDVITFTGKTTSEAVPDIAGSEAAVLRADDAARLVSTDETASFAVTTTDDTVHGEPPTGGIAIGPIAAIRSDHKLRDGSSTTPQQTDPSTFSPHSGDQAEMTIAADKDTLAALLDAKNEKLAPQPHNATPIIPTHVIGDHQSAASFEIDTADEVIGEVPAEDSVVRWAWFDWRLMLVLLPIWGAGRRVIRRRPSKQAT